MKSGIYKITIGPRTFYWGQAQDLHQRKLEHLSAFRRAGHHNPWLQRAYNKHGEAALEFIVVLRCPVEELNAREQEYLDAWCGVAGCANVSTVAEAPWRGKKLTPEHRRKLSESHMGNRQDPAHVARLAEMRRSAVLVRLDSGDERTYPSVGAAAEGIGVTYTSVSKWLNGKRPIPQRYGIAQVERVGAAHTKQTH